MSDYFEKYDFDPFKKMLEPKKPTPKNILIVVLMILAGGLLIFHSLFTFFAPDDFSHRFEQEFLRNQAQINRYSADEFSPALGYLMQLINTNPQHEDVLSQAERVKEKSKAINSLFVRTEAKFPYGNFSRDEQRKIHQFFYFLGQVNEGRDKYVEEMGECARMLNFGINGGYDFCVEQQEDWQKKSTTLLQAMISSLQLTEKEEKNIQKMLGGK